MSYNENGVAAQAWQVAEAVLRADGNRFTEETLAPVFGKAAEHYGSRFDSGGRFLQLPDSFTVFPVDRNRRSEAWPGYSESQGTSSNLPIDQARLEGSNEFRQTSVARNSTSSSNASLPMMEAKFLFDDGPAVRPQARPLRDLDDRDLNILSTLFSHLLTNSSIARLFGAESRGDPERNVVKTSDRQQAFARRDTAQSSRNSDSLSSRVKKRVELMRVLSAEKNSLEGELLDIATWHRSDGSEKAHQLDYGRFQTRCLQDLREKTLSTQVFLGGVPYDINTASLLRTLRSLGMRDVNCHIAMPQRGCRATQVGHRYAIFDSSQDVIRLLEACEAYAAHDPMCNRNGFYFKMVTDRCKNGKLVEVIPWCTDDSTWYNPSFGMVRGEQVFVGAVHGTMTAEMLAKVLCLAFGPVASVSIDIGAYAYPSGSARASFVNYCSYARAVQVKFINVVFQWPKVAKKLQIDPYIVDSTCKNVACREAGSFFCRMCRNYSCARCWFVDHNFLYPYTSLKGHVPLIRAGRRNNSMTTL